MHIGFISIFIVAYYCGGYGCYPAQTRWYMPLFAYVWSGLCQNFKYYTIPTSTTNSCHFGIEADRVYSYFCTASYFMHLSLYRSIFGIPIDTQISDWDIYARISLLHNSCWLGLSLSLVGWKSLSHTLSLLRWLGLSLIGWDSLSHTLSLLHWLRLSLSLVLVGILSLVG